MILETNRIILRPFDESDAECVYELGIGTLYLVTDHAVFYEKFNWEFLCSVKYDGDETSRMYIHESKK